MSASQPVCKSLRPWLKANLGKYCLAPLTSTDSRALDAAVHIVELWNFSDNADLPGAFGAVVRSMQDNTKELAFHAIAHVCDWHTRQQLWNLAGLPALGRRHMCVHEPSRRADQVPEFVAQPQPAEATAS